MMSELLNKSPDEVLRKMLHPNFELKALLKDRQMKINYNWTLAMTTLLEKISTCDGPREDIVTIFAKIPRTSYVDGVHEEITKPDVITDELRFEFVQSFLKMSIRFLDLIPHSADDLTKVFERLELHFFKNKTTSPVRHITLPKQII